MEQFSDTASLYHLKITFFNMCFVSTILVVNKVLSNSLKVTCSVLQGSTVGPQIFKESKT